MRRRTGAFLLGLSLLSAFLHAAEDELLARFGGSYLAYSFDFNQIYGEDVTFRLGDYDIRGHYLKIDLASRTFLVYGGVRVVKKDVSREADEFLFDPQTKNGLLFLYRDEIDVQPLETMNDETRQSLTAKRRGLENVSLTKIKSSFFYATATGIELTPRLEVFGTGVTVFVEGLESVGFTRFKLSIGDRARSNGFSFDKVWFTKQQGLFGKAGYSYQLPDRFQTLTQVLYEEHSILKNYIGLPRQLDVQTSTTWRVQEKLNLGLAGNYNSTSLWNARFWLDKKWKNDKNSVLLDFAYNKPLRLRGESWLGLQSSFDFAKGGRLSFQGRYEIHNQVLANLSYAAQPLKNMAFQLQSSYSQILFGGTGALSRIFSGDVALSYNASFMNIASDYYLNYDLFGSQRLTRPQLRLGFRPLTFYAGLLSATLSDVFIHNTVKRGTSETQSYSNNSLLNIAAQPFSLSKNLNLQVSLALEQFLEKERRNFTSGGLIMRAVQSFGPGITFEAYYSLQSRRKTKNWLIEGTTSQDLSGVFRVQASERLTGWLSLSYNPKDGEWKQAFADLTIGLVKNWRFQSLLNYDFFRKKIGNVDLYLIRHAGRFDLRFIWRSISKQFLVEFIPAF